MCLTSCSGCHINLLHLYDKFIDILKTVDLVYSPLLMDVKKPQECDIAIIEGAIKNREDIENVKALRDKAKILVAMGTCATFGGIAGLGNSFSRDDLITKTYKKENFWNNSPQMNIRTLPLDEIIKVDYHISGCPPPPDVLRDFFDAILEGKEPVVNDLPVCAECSRKVRDEFSPEITRSYEVELDDEECLLQQGIICLGSVTRAGCGALCTSEGAPCFGCRGPTQRIMLEPSHGIFEDLIMRRCHYLDISPEQSEEEITPYLKTLYSFTLSSSFMREKKSERVAEEVYRINVDEEK
jgi:F420-non-reducing hydrogenase small subunit